jgi:hypothetical protein
MTARLWQIGTNRDLPLKDQNSPSGRSMGKSRIAVLIFLLFTVPVLAIPQTVREQKHEVEVRFIQSFYADFLFYLLYRSTG